MFFNMLKSLRFNWVATPNAVRVIDPISAVAMTGRAAATRSAPETRILYTRSSLTICYIIRIVRKKLNGPFFPTKVPCRP